MVDTEFTGTRRLCQVAFVILDGDVLLNTIVNYGKTKEEIIEEDCAQLGAQNSTDHSVTLGSARKFYGVERVEDAEYLIPAEIADPLRQLHISKYTMVEYSALASCDYSIIQSCLIRVSSSTEGEVLPVYRHLSGFHLMMSRLSGRYCYGYYRQTSRIAEITVDHWPKLPWRPG